MKQKLAVKSVNFNGKSLLKCEIVFWLDLLISQIGFYTTCLLNIGQTSCII
nr:MAG TPA: hypothetical protein [Caudoviricetes sp.]